MAGYSSKNFIPDNSQKSFVSGEDIKFPISEFDADGLVIIVEADSTNYVFEHSFDGGKTWIAPTVTPLTTVPVEDANLYEAADGFMGPLGRIRFTGALTADSIFVSRKT